MGACQILKKYAKSRQKAYQVVGQLTGAKARAIADIHRVAEYFSQRSEKVQLKAVNQVEDQIRTILPSEESRFSKLRTSMLTLIQNAKQLKKCSTTQSISNY